jgi:uncharacterized repeat protein (TIGR01451 family)
MKKHLLLFLLFIITLSIHAQKFNYYGSNYYGTTQFGGTYDQGTIIAYDPVSGKDSLMHIFKNVNGENPAGELMQASNGLLYGMSPDGGSASEGLLYCFNIVTQQDSVVINFNGPNGVSPAGNLIQATNGLIYGMTYGGGTHSKGTLFSLDPVTGKDTVLINFNVTNGSAPLGSLIQGADGLLYGLTQGGGLFNYGVLFSYNPVTGKDSIRVSFKGTARGADNPEYTLLQAKSGVMYGTSEQGGSADEGAAFSYNPANGTEDSLIINFSGGAIGARPDCTFIQGKDGLIYGMAIQGGTHGGGIIFSFDPATNKDSIRYNFTGGADGGGPIDKLVQDSATGLMYGMAQTGGASGYGVIFSFNPSTNAEKALASLQRYGTGGNSGSGAYPGSGLILIHRTPPVAHITASPTTICAGLSVQFKDSSTNKPTNWSWTFPGGTPATSTARNPVVTYSAPGTYSVKMTVINTTDIDSITKTNYITVLPNPVETTQSLTLVTCRGYTNGAVSVSAGSAQAPYSYAWSNGSTTSSISGLAEGQYVLTVTDANTCKSTDTIFVGVVPFPITITGKSAVCRGTNDTILISGGIHYAWSNSSTTDSLIVAPSVANTYTVSVQNSTCTLDTLVVIKVDSMPHFRVTYTDTICAGTPDTLTANGATTYVWSNGNTTNNIIVAPVATHTYTLIGVTGTCTRDSSFTVNVKPLAHITINGARGLCRGNTDTVTISGGTTYAWSTGSTRDSIIVTPSTTNTYTVTATLNKCTNDTSFTIHVTQLPVIKVSGKTVLCAGNNDTLTATGATSYIWNTTDTTHNIVVRPTSSITYTVTGTKAGCSADTSIAIYVSSLGVITFSGKNEICTGATDSISVTGGARYHWNNGDTLNTISVNPALTTTYTVAISKGGCLKDTSYTVTVDKLPAVHLTGKATICAGIADTLIASGTKPFTWNTGDTSATIIVSPALNTTYTVSASLGICSADTIIAIVVNPIPSLTISGNTSLCKGNSTKLKASGASTYIWAPFSGISCYSCANITASPTVTTTYTLVGTQNKCSGSVTQTIVVAPSNGFDLAGNLTMCIDTPSVSNASIQACIFNNRCTPVNGTLKLVLDTAFHITSTTADSIAHVSGDTLIWNYDSLSDIGKTHCVSLNGTVSNIPAGDSVAVSMFITPVTGDSVPANNSVTYWVKPTDYKCQGLPFDPNEKSVYPQGDITTNTLLNYTIHFQNTGNAPAHNVVVVDTLSPFVDPTTLKVTSSSAEVNTTISGGNIVTFTFTDINLPDTAMSKTLSIGIVKYTILPLSSDIAGTQIKNHAGIYFDANPEIITNTTVNTIPGAPLFVENISTMLNIAVFPNPFTTSTSIVFNTDGLHYLEVDDVTGRKLESMECIGKQYEFSRKNLAGGVYFIKAFDAEHKYVAVQKIVVQ